MANVKNNNIGHIINVILILVVSYVSLYALLLYKAKVISNMVIPLKDGNPVYDDESIKNWLNAFDRSIYIMMAIILILVLVRYLIEVLVITHEATVIRTILFLVIGTVIVLSLQIYFFKFKAPILEGDNSIIMIYTLSAFFILYIQMVAFVPSCIKYLMFPRNIIFRRK